MLVQPTIFVVGAGAGVDIGLPTGKTLMRSLEGFLMDLLDDGRQMREVCRALDVSQKEIMALKKLRHQIVDSTLPWDHVDDYLANRSDLPMLERLGQFFIIKYLLTAERRSKIWSASEEGFPIEAMRHLWYHRLFQILVSSSDADRVRIFESCTFLILNYDRCLEHALLNIFRIALGLHGNQAEDLLRRATFLHPRGSLGPLPWQGGDLPFGSDKVDHQEVMGKLQSNHPSLPAEQQHLWHRRLGEARAIVFLGCGFHRNNLGFLHPSALGNAMRAHQPIVHATHVGLEGGAVRRRLKSCLPPFAEGLLRASSCLQLLDEIEPDLT